MNDKIQKAPMVPPFVRFVCSAVPMVFDDSLSYYEALSALWKWLQDDVVNVINNNATVTEEYIQLTNDMKEYMDNYFNNLDVQEEINNKLDAMVEAGTLQEIITQYIQANAAWCFDTVADMKLAENLIDGSYAQTFGYHAINDGGNAIYKIREVINTDVVDEKFIIALSDNNLVAELIKPVTMNPEILGAYGDGTHDDSAAIQAAIDTDQPVILTKNYSISSTLNIGNHDSSGSYKTNVKFNASASTISYDGNNSAISISGISGGDIKFGTIEASSGDCIKLSSNNGNVRIAYLDISFKKLSPNGKAFDISESSTGFINEMNFTGGVITSGNYGFYIVANPSSGTYRMNGEHFNNICFEGCSTCYYMEAQAQEFTGFTFNGDRFVENTSSTLFELIGTCREFTMHTWSTLYPERMDLDQATMKNCRFICPVWNKDTNKYMGSGIFYNNTNVKYLFDGYDYSSLSKETGASGSIFVVHSDNNFILNFQSFSCTSASMTVVTAANNRYTPTRKYVGCISDASGNTAKITIESTGEIKFATDAANVGNTFEGEVVFTSFAPERI